GKGHWCSSWHELCLLWLRAMPTISEQKRRKPKPPEEKWWEKAPTLPGASCTPAQRRLADKERYTGVCRLLQVSSLSRIGVEAGDFCTSPPLHATKLLASRSSKELTAPKRAADFRAETDWRLKLRPFSPPVKEARHIWLQVPCPAPTRRPVWPLPAPWRPERHVRQDLNDTDPMDHPRVSPTKRSRRFSAQAYLAAGPVSGSNSAGRVAPGVDLISPLPASAASGHSTAAEPRGAALSRGSGLSRVAVGPAGIGRL
ncbi:unnamed protein product, partial [Effrenium voratum]